MLDTLLPLLEMAQLGEHGLLFERVLLPLVGQGRRYSHRPAARHEVIYRATR